MKQGVIINFMHQFERAIGCLDYTLFLALSVRCFQLRLAFELVDSGK